MVSDLFNTTINGGVSFKIINNDLNLDINSIDEFRSFLFLRIREMHQTNGKKIKILITKRKKFLFFSYNAPIVK
jgi:hypothetical protein